MRTSGPLYLAIIQRPKTEVWYAKSRMGEHKLGSIMKTLAQSLNFDGKRISNHSTRKSVVAKLKKAGQPRHKIIQITRHASESSLEDYDEIGEGERMELSHIISGYKITKSTETATKTTSSLSSLAIPAPSVVVPPLLSSASIPSLDSTQAPTSTKASHDPSVQHFNNCTVSIQNYFGQQKKDQLGSTSGSSHAKRRRPYIIESDED